MRKADISPRKFSSGFSQSKAAQLISDRVIKRGDAIIVKARGLGAKDRHLVGAGGPLTTVALDLLTDIAQRVLCATAVEFVNGNEVGEIQHVNLLQLACGAILGCHDIQASVNQRHDGRVTLANA